MPSALEGITVVDLATGPAGALATMFLCDNGATVVRVEPPAGAALPAEPCDPMWHRGKRRAVVDLDAASAPDAAGRAAYEALVRTADVLVETLAPGSPLQRLVHARRLNGLNSRLVRCSITAYGPKGPRRNEPAIDALVMARLGILEHVPVPRQGPGFIVHPLPSVLAALLAASGVVAALLARERTGRGTRVETSLMAGAMLAWNKVARQTPGQAPLAGTTAVGGPFFEAYPCGDGQWLQLACLHADFEKRAAAALGLLETMAAPRDRAAVESAVADVLASEPYHHWARLLEDADVPYARICTADEACADPQVAFNQGVVETEDGRLGRVRQVGLPVVLSRTPGRVHPRASGADAAAASREPGDAGAAPGRPPGGRRRAESPPLAGTRVLEVTNVIAGPTVGRILVDLGADVVKVEPPEGDISRRASARYFAHLNAGKRSIAVDLRSAEGLEAARRLASGADVLVANLRPGATDRMGIGGERMHAVNPRLVETHVSGFGRDGPYAGRPGVNPLAEALTGMQWAQAGEGGTPSFLGFIAPTDYTAGALGALGTVLALFARARRGAGQRVDTDLLSAGLLINHESILRYDGKRPRPLADGGLHGLSALHRLYEASDGWLCIVAEAESQWSGLCGALGRDDLAADPPFATAQARGQSDALLANELERTVRQRPTAWWLRRLAGAGVPAAPVTTGYEDAFFTDPQAIANDMVTEFEHPTWGRTRYSAGLLRVSGVAASGAGPTPLLGQHTREVLAEAGYTAAAVDALCQGGAVRAEG